MFYKVLVSGVPSELASSHFGLRIYMFYEVLVSGVPSELACYHYFHYVI
jgi:hypothetical protein